MRVRAIPAVHLRVLRAAVLPRAALQVRAAARRLRRAPAARRRAAAHLPQVPRAAVHHRAAAVLRRFSSKARLTKPAISSAAQPAVTRNTVATWPAGVRSAAGLMPRAAARIGPWPGPGFRIVSKVREHPAGY